MSKNSFSVNEFCFQENISRSMFYKICKLGLGPKILKVGRRTLITALSAAEWRKKMEQQPTEDHRHEG